MAQPVCLQLPIPSTTAVHAASSLPPADLPVAARVADILAASRCGGVVVTAPPGSGKTTLVPPALLDDLAGRERVLLVQPRRLAARAVAGQIARLRGVPLGGEVGYVVRFDARVGGDTRLVVETTGVTLRRLADDVCLEGVAAVVLDEFHERSIELDLVLGLLVQLRRTVRPDLRVVVMSATLDTGPVSRLLGEGVVVDVPGRLFPVEVRYEKPGARDELEAAVARRVADALRVTTGHVLVFLPGVGEIVRCERALEGIARTSGHEVVPLFGDLPPERQDAALAETGRRRIVLATNVAETSLTIPGVTAVVDSGLVRRLSVGSATGLPRLEVCRISRASADQRAGRAGRTGPGICFRLWDEPGHHGRAPADPPEILRSDLTEPLLRLAAVGEAEQVFRQAGGPAADPAASSDPAAGFPWLDPPPSAAVTRARDTLALLGAVDSTGRITPLGRELARLPTHPRLARLLVAGAAAGVLRETAVAAALLSDRDPFRQAARAGAGPRDRHEARSRSDVVDRVLALQALHAGVPAEQIDPRPHPPAARGVFAAADQLVRLVEQPRAPRAADPPAALGRALLAAFPDRLARLRPGSRDRGAMVGGRGVRLDAASRVRDEPLFLALDVDDAGAEVRVRLASAVDRGWLDDDAAPHLTRGEQIVFAPARRQVEARVRTCWLDLVIDETPVAITDIDRAAAMLATEARRDLSRWLPPADSVAGSLLVRCRWLASALPEIEMPPLDDEVVAAMLERVCLGLRGLDEIPLADWSTHLAAHIGPQRIADVERLAPTRIDVGGRSRPLVYEVGRPPVLAVRIQDLFGVRQTPRVAAGRVAVLLHLLGPNMRPCQVTDDLASFWVNTYPTVRQELRRRYPKHAWPDDPLA
jgi:ATP-dependent helicase HrpB